MLPEAFITHFVTGRTRIKIPARKGDVSFFTSLKERFSNFPGVQKVEVNPLTGSLLILHSFAPESMDVGKMNAYTELNGLFRLEEKVHSGNGTPFLLRKRFGDSVKSLNQKVTDLTRGEMDLATLAFFLLLGVGIYQMSAGNFAAPAWYVAFWYAMNIFMQAEARGSS
jgi:hypothetical protein